MSNANPQAPPLASVLICTRNRAAYLDQTIQKTAAQTLSAGGFEIVVVDNGSTDATPEVVRRCQSAITAIPLRYVVEAEVGLSAARNRAIREAKGQILCFLDDDAVPDPAWLEWLIRGYAAHPGAMCVGGSIVPVFADALPLWFPPQMEFLFKPELRDTVLYRVSYPLYPYGANVSIRADVVRQVGEFNTALGYKGRELVPSEETEFILRIETSGYEVLMEPRAVVRHYIPESRLTRDYIRRRQYAAGRGRALVEDLHRSDSGKREALFGQVRRLAALGGRRLGLRGRYWPRRLLHQRSARAELFLRQCYLADRMGYRDQQWRMLWRRLWG